MLILGLNAFHGDASACLLKDGRLVAAAEEERFVRVKHRAGFPAEAIAWCLQAAGAEIKDLDIVAVNSDPKARTGARIGYTLRHRPTPGYLLERLRHRWRRLDLRGYFKDCLEPLPAATRIHPVEHHRAHLASAFYCSPYSQAAVLSIDGFGDFCSAAWGTGSQTDIHIQGEVLFPHSLGIFYQAMTQYLGFTAYGDEYKIMGLAPYGRAACIQEMEQLVCSLDTGGYQLNLDYFRHHREKINFQWQQGSPRFETLYSPELEQLLGPAREPGGTLDTRHKDLAHSVQHCYESVLFQLLEDLQSTTGMKELALAGGCAMNSVANGKVYKKTRFKQLYVQPAAGDAGGALGAALCAQRDLGRGFSREPMVHAAWGPEFDDAYIQVMLGHNESGLARQSVDLQHYASDQALCEAVAAALAAGNVVGWFQGRMEWGPRALGQRSILADPRRHNMQELLNIKIKRRESFRPFAPSILRECVDDWFETDDDVPFMMKVFRIKPQCREQIPAVSHVDGSGRLQTVSPELNGRYYQLIRSFADRTGVPMVLNTSFNENEPIVCRPEEALECFLRTGMDALVMGRFVLQRTPD